MDLSLAVRAGDGGFAFLVEGLLRFPPATILPAALLGDVTGHSNHLYAERSTSLSTGLPEVATVAVRDSPERLRPARGATLIRDCRCNCIGQVDEPPRGPRPQVVREQDAEPLCPQVHPDQVAHGARVAEDVSVQEVTPTVRHSQVIESPA